MGIYFLDLTGDQKLAHMKELRRPLSKVLATVSESVEGCLDAHNVSWLHVTFMIESRGSDLEAGDKAVSVFVQ